MSKFVAEIPDFGADGEEESVKWLSILIWILGIVIELIKKIKQELLKP